MDTKKLIQLNELLKEYCDEKIDVKYCGAYSYVVSAVSSVMSEVRKNLAAAGASTEAVVSADADMQELLDTIESAVTLSGYEILDGHGNTLTARCDKTDTDYLITVEELAS